MNKKTWTVYKHTCPNDKVYIGITSLSLKKRWNSGNGYKTCRLFYKAIQKYGWDNISHDILATDLTQDEAQIMEQELIAKYESNNPNKGYNLSEGGNIGFTGMRHSEETRQKMCQRKHSEEEIKKMSESMIGNKNPMYGKTHTIEAREKISKAHKGLPVPNQKKVICLETNKIYESSRKAAISIGVSPNAVSPICRGERPHIKGLHFMYYDEWLTQNKGE